MESLLRSEKVGQGLKGLPEGLCNPSLFAITASRRKLVYGATWVF